DLLARAEEEGLAGADGGAHGLEADRGAVVAHVAFHHHLELGVHLGDAEGAGEHAVAAGDAAGLAGGLDDAVARALDSVGGADLGAGGRVAVHADDGDGLDGAGAVHVLQLDHGVAAVGIALRAGLDTGLAADAAAG